MSPENSQYRVWCILHHTTNDTYHPALFEGTHSVLGNPTEPGEVYLRSRRHHTDGCVNLKDAQDLMFEAAGRDVGVPQGNISPTPIEWDGEVGIVLVLPNWKALGKSVDDVMPRGNPIDMGGVSDEKGDVHKEN